MQVGYRIFFSLLAIAFILMCSSLFISSGIYLLTHNPKAMDFLAFYTGAQLLSQSPSQLYNLHTQLITQQQLSPIVQKSLFIAYVNPPFVAMVFMPLLDRGLLNAYALWTLINTVFFLLICYLGYLQLQTKKLHFKLFFLLGSLTFIPILTSLLIGQLSLFIALVLLLTWIFLRKGWEFRGGLLLSLMLLKPQFLVLPFLAVLLQRRIKLSSGLLSGIIILTVISYFLVGINGLMNFWQTLNSAYHGDLRYDPDLMAQHSLQTALLIFFQTKTLEIIYIPWIISVALICLPTLFLWTKQFSYRSKNFAFQFAILIMATLLTSPHTHFHDLSMLIVAVIVLLSIITKLKPEHKSKLIIFLIIGYAISLIGFLLDMLTQTSTRPLWILTDACYLVLFWLVLFKLHLRNKI